MRPAAPSTRTFFGPAFGISLDTSNSTYQDLMFRSMQWAVSGIVERGQAQSLVTGRALSLDGRCGQVRRPDRGWDAVAQAA